MSIKEFLKPTKVTWKSFILILIIVNLLLPIISFAFTPFFVRVVFYQAYSLQGIAKLIGLDVCGFNLLTSCRPASVFLEQSLLILGILFWLFVYYILASYISKKFTERRTEEKR